MPPQPQPARVVVWRRGKFYFFYRDENGRPKRILCESLGCFNDDQRKATLKLLRERERHDAAIRLRLGSDLDYNHNLVAAVTMYLAHSDGRREIADASLVEIHKALDPFKAWLEQTHPHLTTGKLGRQIFSTYIQTLSSGPHTRNKTRRNLHQMVTWLEGVRPKLLVDAEHLKPALKQEPVEFVDAVAYTPGQLAAAMKKLRPEQAFIFRLLACCGCRIGEARALTWDDIDLERGRITFRNKASHKIKTRRNRILPLVNAPEGEVAPGLLNELRKRHKAGKPVLMAFDRVHWQDSIDITPHQLRANWVSYALSIGIPAEVVSDWAGHSEAVMRRHYKMQVLERRAAKSIQSALGM